MDHTYLVLTFVYLLVGQSVSDAQNVSKMESAITNATTVLDHENDIIGIKKELTKNNDDYLESSLILAALQSKISFSTPILVTTTTNHNEDKQTNTKEESSTMNQLELNIKRRHYDANSNTRTKEYKADETKLKKVLKNIDNKGIARKKQKPGKKRVKSTIGKKRKILQNKNNKQKHIATTTRASKMSIKIENMAKIIPNIKKNMRRQQEEVIPKDPNTLDMILAKGPRVEVKRNKDALCHRHILYPEGPKYDSAGRVYLPAYTTPLSGRLYPETKPPRFILPKCCNCCKKSVLGCE